MPWRNQPTPYYVLVSELMLQQTQVARVLPKFEQFIGRFPSISVLAQASLAELMAAWSGLGYNRRAKYLHQAAREISQMGTVPADFAGLTRLPGIGPNTAGAILAYAFDQPVVFVETNIRTVFIHHFFQNTAKVSDMLIKERVATTLPTDNIREWYWALMDYGAYLKRTVGARLEQANGYKKQGHFAGSLRQIRGQVIRLLTQGQRTMTELHQAISDPRLPGVIKILQAEGLIRRRGDYYSI